MQGTPANAWGRLGREALSYVLSSSLIFGPTLAQAQGPTQGPAPGVNVITPDGRTATKQTITGGVTGSVTGIRTGTISGGNAFNSFSVFQEGAGNTVNLYVPKGAGNLVNIVRDAPVVVNGILNAYKSGQLGGNVFFADPQGFIVGASGVLNVGSLTVTTPTRQSLEGVIRPNGTVDNAAAQSLLRGDLPLSPDGIISIHGRINAETGVRLSGQEVHFGAGAFPPGAKPGHQQKFDATVNTQGRVEAAAISVANGAIEIVAAGDASVAGRLSADGASGNAGRIAVTAGRDVTIAKSARLSASAKGAAGDAGTVVVKAGRNLVARDGAQIAASAAGTGNAGSIELSAAGTETIGLIITDLSSKGGHAGSLLYDPTDLIIGSTSSPPAGTSVLPNIFNPGGNVTLLASNSITVEGNGIIDTRNLSGGFSAGDSGTISITAPTISLLSGAQLRAGVLNQGGSVWKAGDVSLIATQTSGGTASIAAAGSLISGGNLTLTATASLTQTGLLIAQPQAHATIELQSATLNATGDVALTATATANGTAAALTPVATLTSDVFAAVDVLGSSKVTTTHGGITLAATATTDMEAPLATPDITALLSGTALAAVVKATNTARAQLGDTGALSATGAIGITATGNTTVKAIADGSAVSGVVGATVAVGLIDATTTAVIGGQATVAGNALTVAAHSTDLLVATAKATAGGATTPDAGSQSANTLSDPKYGQYETAGGQQIGVAAAIAVADLTNNSSATMGSSVGSIIRGSANITTDTANTSTATADGEGVATGSTGVGAAVALGLSHVANDATLAQQLTATGVDVTAVMAPGGKNVFTASATSGGGGSNVGVAGSVALSLADTESVASFTPAAIVDAGGGSVTIAAADATSVTTLAVPVGAATGGKVGIGASVALSVVADRTTALIDTGASLSDAGSLSVTATGAYDVTTTASAGSAGGVSVTPSVAVAVITNRTEAQINTGTKLSTSTGALTIGASAVATETASATGTAAGGSAAVGAALAVAVVSDDVTATTLRELSSGDALTVSATGSSRGSVTSMASASGGNAADSSGKAMSGEDPDVDNKITSQLGFASADQKASGVGDDQQKQSSGDEGSASKRSASSSEGKVSVAAGISVTVTEATVTATIPDGVNAHAAQRLSVTTDANTDSLVVADASAVGTSAATSKVGIGAAVAVNVAHQKNDATLGNGTHSATGVTVSALQDDLVTPPAQPGTARQDLFTASATSGAGGSSVGIAGSLGLNLIDTESVATIAQNSRVTANGGSVIVAASDASKVTTEALPVAGSVATGGKVGIGASVALSIVANRSTALIDTGVSLTTPGSLSVTATGAYDVTTTASAGSAGGVSITPSAAVAVVTNRTEAQINTGTGTLATTSGDLVIGASALATETTSASGTAAGGSVAVGAAIAVAVVSDDVTATTLRDLSSAGLLTVSATGSSRGSVTSTASASGGNAADSSGNAPSGESANIDDKVTGQLNQASADQKASGVGDDQQKQSSGDEGSASKRSASSSEGKVSVAAGISVTVTEATVTATIPDGVNAHAAQRLSVTTDANTDSLVVADASAVGTSAATSKVGIGAAVAVNVAHQKNDATLGNGTHSATGVTVSALQDDLVTPPAQPGTARQDLFTASATSGAGGSSVGIAGSLGLNLIDTESVATIAQNSRVTANGGSVIVAASDASKVTTEALPVAGSVATGGKVGIGASVALSIVANRSTALIDTGVSLTTPGSLSVTATGAYDVTTTASAGSAGGVSITPSAAVAVVTNRTEAQINTGTGTLATTSGDLVIGASALATETTSASGTAAGGSVAVGAAIAVAVVSDDVTATTLRDLSSAGLLTVSATGSSRGSVTSTASASGGNADDGTATDGNGNPSSKESSTTDDKVTGQLAQASSDQKSSGVGDSSQTMGSDSEGSASNRSASSSEGKVSVAAAISVAVVEATVTATIPDGVNAHAAKLLSVATNANTDSVVTADGSAVGSDQAVSKVGIGIGAAVNVVTQNNYATLGNGTHSANGVTVAALQTDLTNPASTAVRADVLTADATSGAGGSKVGVAGSLGLNLLNISSVAQIDGSASVDAGGGLVTLSSDGSTTITTKAASQAKGGKVGVGASVALALVTVTSAAELDAGATITHAGGLNVSADAATSTDTESQGASAGGVAIDAVVATTTLNDTITAAINGAVQLDSGAVSIVATRTGMQTANATGDTSSGNVGVGASLGLVISTGSANAALNGDLTGSTGLTITASSVETYTSDATASAKGAESTDSGDSKQPTNGGTTSSAKALKDNQSSQLGTSGSDSSGKGGGKVAIAAAVGIAKLGDAVSAAIGPGGYQIQLTGPVAISATNTTQVATKGDGTSFSDSKLGIGVGVALGIMNTSTTASIGDNTALTTTGKVSVDATSSENAASGAPLTAIAIAGASGEKVGIAGALAVAVTSATTSATIGNKVSITTNGAVSVDAENTSALSAKALAAAVGGKVGIGASIATLVSNNTYQATTGSSDQITGSSVLLQAQNNKISGGPSFDLSKPDTLLTQVQAQPLLGTSNYYLEAVAGAAAGTVAVAGGFAVGVFNDTIQASAGSSSLTASNGDVTLNTLDDVTTKVLAGAVALSGNAGVGISSAVISNTSTTTSYLDTAAKVGASKQANVTAAAHQDVAIFGVSAGAADTAGIAGVASVLLSGNTVDAHLAQGAAVVSGTNAQVTANNTFTALTVAGSAAGGGSAGIGGSAAAVSENGITEAIVANGASITTHGSGNATVEATATENSTVFALSGAGAGSVAIAIGVSVDKVGAMTEALVGDPTTTTGGPAALTIAGDARVHAQDDTSFKDFTGTLAIGGDAGAGIGVDVGLIGKHTTAAIGQGAQVTAANVSLEADSSETIQSVSAGVAAGVYVGAAGALGVYSVTTNTSATIGQQAQVTALRNVAVLASDVTLTDFFVGGVGISGVVGLGASVGVALVNATTTALIDQKALVSAQGTGQGADYIDGFAVSFAPNSVSDLIVAPNPDGQINAASGGDVAPESASATRDAAARLILDARTATPAMRTANGVVVDATDQTRVRSLTIAAGVGAVGISMSGNVPVVSATTTATIANGATINSPVNSGASAAQSAVVNAASDFYQIGVAGSAGGGAVGAGAGAQVSVITPTTTASIGPGARVYTRGDTVVTAASREDFLAAAAAAAAGGTSLAGGVAVIALHSATTADIGANAIVTAGGNLAVLADDQTRTAMIAGSVSLAGGVGVGGSIGVTTISKDTEAYIDQGASVTALGNANGLDAYTGASAGAFDATGKMTGLLVQANSNESVFTLAFAGALGFTAGVAGAVTVPEIMATTKAYIGTNVTINPDNAGAAVTQGVNVTARDSSTIVSIDGSLGAGVFGGVAGSIDVGTIQDDTIASIGDGTTITVRQGVTVNALASKGIDSTAVSAAGSVGVAIAAGISVYSVGNGLDSNGSSQLQTPGAQSSSVNSYADSQSSNNQTDSIVQQSPNADVKSTSTQAQAARGGVQTSGALSGAQAHGTSATVGNVQVTAGGKLAVQGVDQLNGKLLDGAAAVGSGAVGAGIGVLSVTPSVTAGIASNRTLNVGGLTVQATTDHTLGGNSAAGALGLVSAQASVDQLTDHTDTQAYLSGATVVTAGDVTVGSSVTRALNAHADGAAVSYAAAVGAVIATADIAGVGDARIDGGTTIGSGANQAASVHIDSVDADTAIAVTRAAQAGIGGAITGSVATATVATVTDAFINGGAIYATGLVEIKATETDWANAEALGIAVAGGLSVGASTATATLTPTVLSGIGIDPRAGTPQVQTATSVSAGSLDLEADAQLAAPPQPNPDFPQASVFATATGASGALIGISATDAEAFDRVQAITQVGSGSALTVTGAATVASQADTLQVAYSTGLSLGFVAAGSNVARATDQASSIATLADSVQVSAGSFTLNAAGTSSNSASAVAGSGGVIAGAASLAATDDRSVTEAKAGTDTIVVTDNTNAHGLEITATHVSIFGGSVDSTQAAVAGASGSTITHDVQSLVTAQLGNSSQLQDSLTPGTGAQVTAYGTDILAVNEAHGYFLGEQPYSFRNGSGPAANYNPDNAPYDVTSGSGGLISGPAGFVSVAIGQTTTAAIGDNSSIHILPASGAQPALLTVEAYNEAIAHEKAKLDSGGAIAIAAANTDLEVGTAQAPVLAQVLIGPKVTILNDIGDIDVGAWTRVDLNAQSVATTYGLAGAPSGEAYANVHSATATTVGDGSLLQATYGNVVLAAGVDPTGTMRSDIVAHATVDLYNNTAIPIPIPPDAQANVASFANVTINGVVPLNETVPITQGVLAAGDISLLADRGAVSVSAVGTGKNIYLEALSATASAISNLFGGGPVTFDITSGSTSNTGLALATVDGLVLTGLQRDKSLSISYATAATATNGCDVTLSLCYAVSSNGINYTQSTYPIGTTILTEIATLESLLAQYSGDPVALAAYRSEIAFLEQKLVALGLATTSNGAVTPPALSQPSPLAVAQQNLKNLQSALVSLSGSFDQETSQIVASVPLVKTAQGSNDTTVGAIVTAYNAGNTAAGSVANSAGGLSDKALVDPATSVAYLTEISTANSANTGLFSDMTTRKAGNVTQQGIIDGANNDIATQSAINTDAARGAIQTDRANILAATGQINTNNSIIASDASSIAANLSKVNAAAIALRGGANAPNDADIINALNTQLPTVTGQASVILAQVGNTTNPNAQIASTLLAMKAQDAYGFISLTSADTSQVNSLLPTLGAYKPGDAGTASSLSTISASTVANNTLAQDVISRLAANQTLGSQPAIDANNTQILNDLSTYKSNLTSIQGSQTSILNASKTVNDLPTVSTINSLLGTPAYTATVSAENQAIATLTSSINGPNPPSNIPPSAPTSIAFTLDNVVAKLGTITVTGDALVGSGKLLAPGNAMISITNNTAASLLLNNLTVSATQGGTITFNKVLVNTAGDINALNPGGYKANFAEVTSAYSQGAALPTVDIESNYDPNSKVYFDPSLLVTGACAGGSGQCQTLASGYVGTVPYFLWHPLPAPDIVVNDSASISNPLGGVVIHSAAGDIDVNGSINAGTVDVQAKNGDFVQKYVYGFDHLAGDPANVKNPSQPNAPGAGIVSNGAIYIAARYLDINGLIQSGIDQWNLALPTAGSAILTSTDVMDAGLTNQQVTDAQNTFGNILTRTPTTCATVGLQVTCYFASGSPQTLDAKYFLIRGSQDIGVSLSGTLGNLTYDLTQKRVELTMATAQSAYGANSADRYFALAADYGNIGATYDASLNQYNVNSIAAQGGLIQLYGQIMNTASSGATLRVLDGYAQVNVTNASNLDVVVSKLSTGQDRNGGSGGSSGNVAAGRGTAGVIDITDIQGVFGDNLGSTQAFGLNATTKAAYEIHSIYTRDYDPITGASNTVLNLTTGYLDSRGQFTLASTASPSNGAAGSRSTSYAPQSGLRYVYTTGTDQSTAYYLTYSGTQFFGSSDLQTAPTGHLDSSSGPFNTGAPILLDGGTYLANGSLPALSGLSGWTAVSTPTASGATASFSVANGKPTYVQTDSWSDCNWWTLCIAQDYHYNVTQTVPTLKETIVSLKADNPIAIQFGGVDHGVISISSPSNVILTGTLTNLAGDTTITSTKATITATSGADIIARNIDLNAPLGSIGQVTGSITGPATAPVPIDLRGGSLVATAPNGNVVVSANGNLVLGQVIAGGDPSALLGRAVLSAGGSITAAAGLAPGSVEVQAPRVELTAANGGIGTADAPLVVDTGYADLASGQRPFGDPSQTNPSPPVLGLYLGLQAQAQGDINIAAGSWSQNTNADILADQIVSLAGNVTLTTPGRVLDNNPVESVDTRTYQQLLNYWNQLALVADGPTGANTLKQQATLTAYALQQTTAYKQYWKIRDSQPDKGAVYDPNYVYVPSAVVTQALTAQNIDLAKYAKDITSSYHALNAQVGALTTSYVSNYAYTTADIPSTVSSQLLRGATWTVNELALALSPGALKTVTGTNPVIKLANVGGKTVTLNAGAGIGEASTQIVIDTSKPVDPATLTDAQKVALAAAERADIVFAKDGSNIVIDTNRPLNVAAASALNVLVGNTNNRQTYNGDAFLASLDNLPLGTIDVPGDVRIKTYGSIIAAPVSSFVTGNLILEAADGGIGISRNPITGVQTDSGFTIAPETGATIVARAQLGIDLQVTGPARVDTIYSPANVSLTASGDLINANADLLINILGTDVTLSTPNGSIGAANNPLNVGNNLGGGIFASAPKGSVYLYGPSGFLFNLESVQAQGFVAATASIDMTVNGPINGPAGVTLIAGQQLTIGATGNAFSALGDATLNAGAVQIIDGGTVSAPLGNIRIDASAGDAVVTGLSSGLAAADAIQITAKGRILGGSGTPADITDTQGGAILVAGAGIGNANVDDTAQLADLVLSPDFGPVANPLRLQVAGFSALSTAGDLDLSIRGAATTGSAAANSGNIALTSQADLHATTLSAPKGSITVNGGGGLVLDTVTAGGDVSADAATIATVHQLTSTGGSANIAAAGLVTVDTITTATGIALNSTASAIALGTANSSGPVTLDAANDIDFASITTAGSTSSLNATSHAGAISGGTIDAAAGVTLQAAGSINGDRIIALDGVVIGSGAGVTWNAILSGGTQQITAAGDIRIISLTTAGLQDPPDVDLLSTTGQIAVSDIASIGSVNATAATDVTIGSIIAADQVNLLAMAGTVQVGSIESGGTATLDASASVIFQSIATTGTPSDPGAVIIHAGSGPVQGQTLIAAGDISLSGNGIELGTVRGGGNGDIVSRGDISATLISVAGDLALVGDPQHRVDIAEIDAASLSASGADTISLPNLKVGRFLSLGARVIEVTAQQVPLAGPLLLDITGINGAPAETVTLQIDSPHGLAIGGFSAIDSTIGTTAVNVSLAQANVPGSLVVQTPIDTLLIDNRSPVPGRSPDQQLFQPGGAFYFNLRDKGLITNAFVVEYHSGSQIINILDGSPYRGASLVRDEVRIYRNGEFDPISPNDPALRYGPLATLAEEIAATYGAWMPNLVELPADGRPAVNLVRPSP